MSIRNQLLQEIHSAKGCTLADLMDGTGFDRKRLHDNLKSLKRHSVKPTKPWQKHNASHQHRRLSKSRLQPSRIL